MPTYEYACEACGHHWDAVQSMKDAVITRCPKCKKHKAKRLVSGGTGFVLKGGGWYSDLYSSAKARKDDGGGAAESSDKSDTSSKSDDAASSDKKSSPGKARKSKRGKKSKPGKTKSE